MAIWRGGFDSGRVLFRLGDGAAGTTNANESSHSCTLMATKSAVSIMRLPPDSFCSFRRTKVSGVLAAPSI
jgi:hypothetical protein